MVPVPAVPIVPLVPVVAFALTEDDALRLFVGGVQSMMEDMSNIAACWRRCTWLESLLRWRSEEDGLLL